MSSRLPIGGVCSTFRADRSHDKKILESAKLLSLLQRRKKRNGSKQADDHIILSNRPMITSSSPTVTLLSLLTREFAHAPKAVMLLSSPCRDVPWLAVP